MPFGCRIFNSCYAANINYLSAAYRFLRDELKTQIIQFIAPVRRNESGVQEGYQVL